VPEFGEIICARANTLAAAVRITIRMDRWKSVLPQVIVLLDEPAWR
jgi:hypothetical protein